MPQSHYRTDWLCIATSGQAVDGRTIEPQWLIDAAETYTRKTYTAMIWPHHPQYDISEREFTCNLGEVDALKVETEGDVTKLYAQLIPNQFLIEANRQGQKLFTSAEFVTDFAGSGREYLFGLAVTDIPASLGTEKLKFVLAGEEKDAERGSLETFSLGKLQTSKPDKKDSFWSRLFSASKDFTPTPESNTDKPTEGDGEKMEELKALIQQMLDLLKSGKDAAAGD
ncbi:GPO family capsid scaffolding protein, partial [Salmonella enterica]